MTILDEIVSRLATRPPYGGPDLSGTPRRSLAAAIRSRRGGAVIAEFKRRSPSRGDIAPEGDPAATALGYARRGAVAISVLTEPHYFGGSPADLAAARAASGLPVLRKDFLLQEADIDESVAMGADAVLFIARTLGGRLRTLLRRAGASGLEALVEVHDEEEMALALRAKASLIGINNRDLASMTTDLDVSRRLLPLIGGRALTVSESGISRRAEIDELSRLGADAFLVGESLLLGTADVFGEAGR